jgi:hypothetical protein
VQMSRGSSGIGLTFQRRIVNAAAQIHGVQSA